MTVDALVGARFPSHHGLVPLLHRQGHRRFDGGDAVLDRLLHLLEGAHLDLAHALA